MNLRGSTTGAVLDTILVALWAVSDGNKSFSISQSTLASYNLGTHGGLKLSLYLCGFVRIVCLLFILQRDLVWMN